MVSKKTKFVYRVVSLVLASLMILGVFVMVFAQVVSASTVIHIDNTSPAVGDTINVYVTASESGDFTVTYDASLLRLSSSQGSAVNGSVNFSDTTGSGAMSFEVIGSGRAVVAVSSSSLGNSSASITAGSGSTNDSSNNSNNNNTSNTVSSNNSNNTNTNSNSTNTQSTTEDTDVEESEGNNTELQVTEQDTVLESSNISIVTVTPSGFLGDFSNPANIEFGGVSLVAYKSSKTDRFYLVYGRGADGEEAWYQLDVTDGTIQRFNETLVEDKESIEEEVVATDTTDGESFVKKYRNYIAVGIFVAVVLLIIIINIAISRSQRDGYEDDYEDSYDNHDTEDDGVKNLEDDEEEESAMSFEESYSTIKGGEAFQSKDMMPQSKKVDKTVDIMDLNDL